MTNIEIQIPEQSEARESAELSERQRIAQMRRKVLMQLSADAREIREGRAQRAIEEGDQEEAMKWINKTLNDIIIEEYYTTDEHREFHTLFGWRELGYRVKKGSKAFTIWGKPKMVHAKQLPEAPPEQDPAKYEYYPMSYLFSNKQVERVTS